MFCSPHSINFLGLVSLFFTITFGSLHCSVHSEGVHSAWCSFPFQISSVFWSVHFTCSVRYWPENTAYILVLPSHRVRGSYNALYACAYIKQLVSERAFLKHCFLVKLLVIVQFFCSALWCGNDSACFLHFLFLTDVSYTGSVSCDNVSLPIYRSAIWYGCASTWLVKVIAWKLHLKSRRKKPIASVYNMLVLLLLTWLQCS